MHLKNLNIPNLIVDDLIINTDEVLIHFISRPIYELSVPKKWNSIIYTSETIKKILTHKIDKIPGSKIKVLNPFMWYEIKINDKALRVALMPTGDYTENVMFMFSNTDNTEITLYTGYFINFENIKKHNFFFKYKCFIRCVYFDNKYVSQNINIIGSSILTILEKNPGYKIEFQLPHLGCEDLIAFLSQNCKILIYVNELRGLIFDKHKIKRCEFRKDAQICFHDTAEIFTMKKLENRYVHDKIITFRLGIAPQDKVEKQYIYYVNWSDHPTMNKLKELFYLFEPHINIYSLFKSIKVSEELTNIVFRTNSFIESSLINRDMLNSNVYKDDENSFFDDMNNNYIIPSNLVLDMLDACKNYTTILELDSTNDSGAAKKGDLKTQDLMHFESNEENTESANIPQHQSSNDSIYACSSDNENASINSLEQYQNIRTKNWIKNIHRVNLNKQSELFVSCGNNKVSLNETKDVQRNKRKKTLMQKHSKRLHHHSQRRGEIIYEDSNSEDRDIVL